MEYEIPSHITRISFGAKYGDGMAVDANSIKAYQLVDNMFLELDIPDVIGHDSTLYITSNSRNVLIGSLQMGSRSVSFYRAEGESSQVDIKITYELIPMAEDLSTVVMDAAGNTWTKPLML